MPSHQKVTQNRAGKGTYSFTIYITKNNQSQGQLLLRERSICSYEQETEEKT